MARDEINVHIPEQDATQSIELVKITKQEINQANGIKILNALANKNNSVQIYIENTGGDSTFTVKAGDNYPNAMLGDLTEPITGGNLCAILPVDISRFENRDGSIDFDFPEGFTGNIWVTAKRVGMKPVA